LHALNSSHSSTSLSVILFSSENGSPIDAGEEGTLIATVVKKPRGNGTETAASFGLNIGGKTISLNDHNDLEGLNTENRNSARDQIKVLQDQMKSIMLKLEQ
jgi:hypothetical protein